eukprot:SAG31_NODE_471_length_15238_cov_14.684554_3_plen_226_part_00
MHSRRMQAVVPMWWIPHAKKWVSERLREALLLLAVCRRLAFETSRASWCRWQSTDANIRCVTASSTELTVRRGAGAHTVHLASGLSKVFHSARSIADALGAPLRQRHFNCLGFVHVGLIHASTLQGWHRRRDGTQVASATKEGKDAARKRSTSRAPPPSLTASGSLRPDEKLHPPGQWCETDRLTQVRLRSRAQTSCSLIVSRVLRMWAVVRMACRREARHPLSD